MSVDTANINLLNLTQPDTILKKKGLSQGGEWAGPCPFCGGKDRFIVWPNHEGGGRWWCRQENIGGDAISYVMRRDNADFKAALETLGLQGNPPPPRAYRHARPESPRPTVHTSEPREWVALNNADWQLAADRFMWTCNDALFDQKNRAALDYLLERGFSDTTLDLYHLGYNAQSRKELWGGHEVYLPQGWVIPWVLRSTVWKINTRRPAGNDPKYLMVSGSANGLFNSYMIRPDKPALLVEGEFDCLAIQQAAGDLVTPLATGATTGARLDRWLGRIAIADRYIVSYDDDHAGQEASKFWMSVLPGATRLVPTEHDPNDMLRLQGPGAIRDWIQQVL